MQTMPLSCIDIRHLSGSETVPANQSHQMPTVHTYAQQPPQKCSHDLGRKKEKVREKRINRQIGIYVKAEHMHIKSMNNSVVWSVCSVLFEGFRFLSEGLSRILVN